VRDGNWWIYLLAHKLPVSHQNYQNAKDPGRRLGFFGHVEEPTTLGTKVGTIQVLGLSYVLVTVWTVNTHGPPSSITDQGLPVAKWRSYQNPSLKTYHISAMDDWISRILRQRRVTSVIIGTGKGRVRGIRKDLLNSPI
jgi:hypothetical protein